MDRAENASGLKITAYKHFCIRVSDRAEALAFYGKLGFIEDAYFPDYPANEMVSNGGVRINLIFNGERRENGHNVLFDENCRYPGITHPAFVVEDLGELSKLCGREGITITEGPIEVDARRRALFIREPRR